MQRKLKQCGRNSNPRRLSLAVQIFGREKQIQRMAQILARRTKNNPILLGEPGVGKTAIAEGLAYAIVRGTHEDGVPVPEFLRNKRILSLDVGLMVAGAKERGELENRVTKLIAECKEDRDIILMSAHPTSLPSLFYPLIFFCMLFS
jgi:ATP-dependent Clp protease ATP-binding subunit ClpA